MPERKIRKRIGELLVEREVITKDQLEEALKVQTESKKLLGEVLLDLGYATEEEVMICITTQYGMPFLPLENYDIDPEVIKSVPANLAKKYNFIPIDKIGDLMTIVVSEVLDSDIISQIESSLGCKIETFITTPSALRNGVEKYYR